MKNVYVSSAVSSDCLIKRSVAQRGRTSLRVKTNYVDHNFYLKSLYVHYNDPNLYTL